MRNRSPFLIGLLVLLLAQAVWNKAFVYERWKRDYMPKSEGVAAGLDPSQLLAALAGFRELVAGILWVRADSFFDNGNYDAVLPIIRLVTWLDPHQLDVFATGMWHIGYNFTDEESRSDRRYLPAALALGKEGAKQNPQTYEIFFETGWLWYHKIDDLYPNAVHWFEEAGKRDDILPARRNLLATAYLRNGEIDKSLDLYYKLFNSADKAFSADPLFQSRQVRDTIENNLDTLIVRMIQRGHFAAKRKDGSFEALPYDVKPPFDVGFSVRATVEEAKVIRLEGTYNVLPVGTRIRVVLKGKDFPHQVPGGADWDWEEAVNLDPDPSLTFMQDQLYVKNRKFNRKVDMSRDPTMYPFLDDEYILEFYYNPRSAPPHIQDKFGFNGEGMTDKRYMTKEIREGQNVLYCKMTLTKEQLLRRGKWRDEVPVLETPNFKSASSLVGTDDMIIVPNLRAPGQQAPTNQADPSKVRRPVPLGT